MCGGTGCSDNCLAGGRTFDYGPFGFVERYQREWNMWHNGGAHFGFMNQARVLLSVCLSVCLFIALSLSLSLSLSL